MRALAALLVLLNAGVAAAAEPLPIPEVHPTILPGDGVLHISCPGLAAGERARVILSGRPEGRDTVGTMVGSATTAADQASLRLGGFRPVRLEDVTIEVQQGERVWKLPPERHLRLVVTEPELGAPPPPQVALPASGRDDTPATLEIRDVAPTSLQPGDTLVIECPGLSLAHTARATFSGLYEGVPKTFKENARTAGGDRALVTFSERRLMRLTDATVEVTQGSRVWKLPPGRAFTLEVGPPGLASTARELGRRWPALGAHPALVVAALVLIVALVIHLLVAPVTGILVVWERKIWGRMQSRVGPNRVGPHGWGQWLADAIKMITKEDIVPTAADAGLFRFAPYLMWMSVFASFVVLPLTGSAVVADMNVGLLYLISFTSLTVIAVLLGGWTSNSKWSLLGGMRSAAQIVSYELPASLALLQVALLAGSLAPQAIVRSQGGLPHQWFLFSNPLTFVSFFIYFIAALAEANRTPFDLPEAESELVAGFTTEYSGFRYGVFSLAEWTNLYVLGALVSVAFLGGWNVPFVSADEVAASAALTLLSAAIMIAKVVVLVFVIIWIRATLPRFRMDQLMALCWKYLVPIGFATFVGTAAWLWLTHAVPALGTAVRWATFLLGGVGLTAFFALRVVANFRGSRLLDPPAPEAAP